MKRKELKRIGVVYVLGLLLFFNTANDIYAQSDELDSETQKQFYSYITENFRGSTIIGKNEWDGNNHSIPIKQEAVEMCKKAMEFIANGGELTMLLWESNGYRTQFYISFDEATNSIILTNSGNSM